MPCVVDVLSRAPTVAVAIEAPEIDLCSSQWAKAVEDVARLLAQVLLHHQMGAQTAGKTPVILLDTHILIAAPIVFQVINSPFVPNLGILLLVAEASQIAATSGCSRRAVDAELQSAFVKPVHQSLHRGEFLVGIQRSVGIALRSFPTIINIDVAIAIVGQAFVNQCLCRGNYLIL